MNNNKLIIDMCKKWYIYLKNDNLTLEETFDLIREEFGFQNFKIIYTIISSFISSKNKIFIKILKTLKLGKMFNQPLPELPPNLNLTLPPKRNYNRIILIQILMWMKRMIISITRMRRMSIMRMMRRRINDIAHLSRHLYLSYFILLNKIMISYK
jgi:hypothetical protein